MALRVLGKAPLPGLLRISYAQATNAAIDVDEIAQVYPKEAKPFE